MSRPDRILIFAFDPRTERNVTFRMDMGLYTLAEGLWLLRSYGYKMLYAVRGRPR